MSKAVKGLKRVLKEYFPANRGKSSNREGCSVSTDDVKVPNLPDFSLL